MNANIVVVVLMVLVSIIMLSGKGSILIAGFNTKSKEEKEKYDTISLSKFSGKVFLMTAGMMFLSGIETLTELTWFWPVWAICLALLLGTSIVYMNTGNRFKK